MSYYLEFHVTFRKRVDEHLINLDGRCVGLKDLCELRKNNRESDTSNIKLKLETYVPGINIKQYTIRICESCAEKSGFFENNSSIVVYVNDPLKKFNNYVYETVEESNDDGIVGIFKRIDDKKIIQDWIAAGYPTTWDLGIEE